MYFILNSFSSYIFRFTNLSSPAISNLPSIPHTVFFILDVIGFTSRSSAGSLQIFHVSTFLNTNNTVIITTLVSSANSYICVKSSLVLSIFLIISHVSLLLYMPDNHWLDFILVRAEYFCISVSIFDVCPGMQLSYLEIV